jgi:hypothetical protein
VPGYQPAAAKLGPLQFSAKAQGSTDRATISGLSLRAGQTSLNGQASMDKSSGKPFYSAALKGGTVDVSPFMPPPAKGGSSSGERWSREKLDLSALQSMDADVDFSADLRQHHCHRQSERNSRCATRSPSSNSGNI